MLLAVTFTEFIVKINVIIGIIIASLGLGAIFLSRRITQMVDKVEIISKSSKTYVISKVVGLVMLLVGMILIALP